MTTFMKQFNNQIHVGCTPRGSVNMDPYTKAALTIDAIKQVEKTVKRKPNNSVMLNERQFEMAKDIANHIYGAPIPVNSMTEGEKEYCKNDAAATLKIIGRDDFFLKQVLNASVNEEIAKQFGKDGKRK